MTDPKRLLDDDTTELEKLLLSAVTRERPSRSLTRRMRAGVGLAGSLFTLKAAAAALSVAVVVTGAAVVAERAREAPAAPAPSTSAPVRVLPAPAPAPEVSAAPPPSETAEALRAPVPVEEAPVTPRSKTAPALPDLTEQMRLLESARAALRGGAPAAALSALDRYRKLYPRGAFAQEASVLRIDALRRTGQHAQASSLARDFIRRYPESPHVERISRSLEPANSKP